MPAKGKSIVKLIPEEVISYYSNHSNNHTQKHFGAKWLRIKKILVDNNVTLHTRSENLNLSIIEISNGDTEAYWDERKKKFQNSIKDSDNFKTNRVSKIKATKEEKYGENYASILGQKAVNTKREKYGSADMFHSEKANKTKLELYGDENYNNREKCAETKLERFGDPNYNNRDKMKETKLNNWGSSSYVNPTKAVSTKREKYQVWPHNKAIYEHNGIKFDSLPELAFWFYANDNGFEIQREPIKLEYTFNNKIHYCYPDFICNGELIEIKGPHLINEEGILISPFYKDDIEAERLKVKTKTLLDNGVRFMLQDEYNYYVDWFNQHYNKDDYKVIKEGC